MYRKREKNQSPYLQYFIGLKQFTHAEPFDSNTMCWFRKRLSSEILSEVNDYLTGRKTIKGKKDDDQGNPPASSNGKGDQGKEKPENKGTLILDATCVPADISFPTDVALLNDGREKLEEIIDTLHQAGITGGQKPRTYREKARKQYLRLPETANRGRKIYEKR